MHLFADKTLRYLRGLLGDDADDVQQDLWLTVYRELGGLANPGAFRTWLFRTTRHRAIDFLRKRRRERELFDDVDLETVDGTMDDDASESWIDAATVGAALTSIPSLQREVLLLKYRHEMSYHEIALVVGCPIGTVRTRLFHAKRRLHELLQREMP
jgi:RNA polymerase sigma-70 factor (ECF subfamily)